MRRSTEPIDAGVWHWFICNGPHGERFNWHRDSPHPLRDVEMLAEFIAEKELAQPGFTERAREIALEALANPDPIVVLKGVQVLTVVGTDADLVEAASLFAHPDERVVKHTKAALFERRIKVKSREA